MTGHFCASSSDLLRDCYLAPHETSIRLLTVNPTVFLNPLCLTAEVTSASPLTCLLFLQLVTASSFTENIEAEG